MMERVDKNMRALKALVIVMGIAIIAGLAVLVTLILERGSRLAREESPAAVTQAVPGGVRALALPAGARVLETRLDDGRIALRVTLTEGGEAVFLFDAASGRLLMRYDIAAGATATAP